MNLGQYFPLLRRDPLFFILFALLATLRTRFCSSTTAPLPTNLPRRGLPSAFVFVTSFLSSFT